MKTLYKEINFMKSHSSIFTIKQKILLAVFSLCILFGVLHYLGFIYILPIPKYHKRTEPINLQGICQEIKNSQSRELCFAIVENNNFEQSLNLVSKTKKYSLENYPWYDFPYYSSPRYNYFPGGIKGMLMEGEKYDSDWWCKEIYLSYTPLKEDYYFCRAFLENPYFCNKISYWVGPSKGICYQDASLIWEDSSLCQEAAYPDFCYLRLVLKKLENQEKKNN